MRDRLGMKEESARAFLEAELQKRVSTSSFYFENEHLHGLYLSFETRRTPDRIAEAFPPAHLARLREIKRRYDPEAVFRDNFAIGEDVNGG